MQKEILKRYFSDLTPTQLQQFGLLEDLYRQWNEKINVISRKDIDNLYLRHVLHSLAIAKFLGPLVPDTSIVDIGTGGGFPAIPLAIFYPSVRFHLVDRIAKKLRVAEDIANQIGLTDISIQHGDMSECHAKFDFAVSRAAMDLENLVKYASKVIDRKNKNNHRNGLVCLKGGDLADEISKVSLPVVEVPIREYFNEDFFDTKEVVYVPMV